MNASKKMLNGGGAGCSKKLLAAVAVLAIAMSVFACVTVSEDADAASTTYISGGIEKDFTVTDGMVVVVNGDLKIDKGLTLTVMSGATLTINSDVKVTVDGQDASAENNAKFVVEDGARVVINGQLIVGQYGEAYRTTPSNDEATTGQDDSATFYEGVFVYGSVTAQKGAKLDLAAEIMNGGSVVVSSTNKYVSTIGGVLILMPGATVEIDGFIAEGNATYKNYGLLVAACAQDFSKAAGDGAYYGSVIGITGEKPAYDDRGYPTTDSVSLGFTAASQSQTVYYKLDGVVKKTTAVAANLSVEGKVADADISVLDAGDISEKDESETVYYTDKDCKTVSELAACDIISDELRIAEGASITVDADLVVSGALTVDEDAEFTVTGGRMTVSGTVTAVDTSFTEKEEDSEAVLAIDGGTFEVTIEGAAFDVYDVFSKFEGAYYILDATTTDSLIACELAVAIAAADGDSVQEVVVSGAEGADLKKAGYVVAESFTLPAKVTLTVINGLVIGEDIVVIVAEDAELELDAGTIYVDGKLIDVMGKADGEKIVADVIFTEDEDKTIIYTSLAIAISDVGSGKITLKNDATVSEDMTIPADITVDLNSKTMTVAKGKTLTVEGVIDASTGSIATADKTAKVVVDNYIVVKDGNVKYVEATFNVAGIYATANIDDIDGTYFVMSVPFYARNVADVTSASVQGALSYAKDVTFAGTADDIKTLTIDENASFAVTGTITISYFVIDADGALTAAVANSVGQISLKSVSGVTVSDVVSEDDGTSLQIAGTVASAKDAAVTIASGKLTVAEAFDASNLASFNVASGTELIVSVDAKVKAMAIDGTLTVSAGTLTVSSDLTVAGTVAIAKDAVVAVTGDAYIGMTADDLTGAAVAVSGEGKLTAKLLYIAPGSSVAAATLKDLKSTKFTSEGNELFTIYGSGTTIDITKITPAVSNAKFLYWYDAKDTAQAQLADSITVGSPAEAVAKIKTDIYTVTVVGDNGIGTVAIDGNVLVKSSNTFQISDLKAGQHTITVDLKYGFEGNPVIKVNGTAISGSTFTLSGVSADDTNVKIDISGTTPSSIDPVVPDNKDDGMKLTDYLLIVLVVLIVILAVIVAMRLMRS